uniref:Constituent protein n=1 Tax=uncultured organism MedDCM-OCT-S11-C359 TaxID=743661 RepID=D6PLG7_9ZZZZ|nr:constituent protein [uncultured organism MedDCM-OCT-S11-C359]
MVESDSSFSINAETVALPSGFLQVRDLFILSGGTKYALTYMTPPQMDQIKGSSTSGMPVAYTIIGDNFRFAPTPDSTYTGTLNYYKSFDALSDSNTTNYILTNHPAIYLYGSLYHAANFLGGVEPARLQQWQGMYTTALERLERNDREDQFSGSPLQIRSDVTVASSFQDTTKVTNNNT